MSENFEDNLSGGEFLLGSESTIPGVSVSDRCFASNGVYCESCREACQFGALRFAPQLDSVPQIAYDTEFCTLCGECALACPQDAISMQQQKPARG